MQVWMVELYATGDFM